MKNNSIFLGILLFAACTSPKENTETEKIQLEIHQATEWLTIDGKVTEASWDKAEWWNIDQKWLGPDYSSEDFTGRFKMLWRDSLVYVLAEIQDDTLMDIHEDGLAFYWDDDCLEVFIDENASGGNHQYNHNALAYHVGLNYKVTDLGLDSLPGYYDHVKAGRIQKGNLSVWELAITVYNDTYQDFQEKNEVVKLTHGKVLGFAAAYCDNDRSTERENFIGSMPIEGEDKNRGWIDASLFTKYNLVE